MIGNFLEIRRALHGKPPLRLVIVGAQDLAVIEAVKVASHLGWVKPITICFSEEKTFNGLLVSQNIVEPDPQKAAKLATELVNQGEADLIMKGQVQTADLLHPVVMKENGLVKPESLLSHVGVIALPNRKRMTLISDCAVNIYPDMEAKAKIIDNTILVARVLGYEPPKVAVLSALEKENSKIQSSVEAARLKTMGENGRFGDALISGPLALDNALLQDAAKIKHVDDDPVAGHADILIVPELVSGNILYKSFTVIAGYPGAGVIVGAKIPIILTSRADHSEVKVNSIAVACLLKNAAK